MFSLVVYMLEIALFFFFFKFLLLVTFRLFGYHYGSERLGMNVHRRALGIHFEVIESHQQTRSDVLFQQAAIKT